MNRGPKNIYVNIIILFLAVFYVVIHLVYSYNLEYHRDELLYFSLGQHPAFGYATVPPMIGWIAWLMKSLFGYSLFAVRLFPAIMGGVIIILSSAIASGLGGSDYSRILTATGIAVSMIALRTFLMFQPVHIDLIFWTLIFYLIVKYINTTSGKYLVLIGITFGAAMLNKYLIALLLIIMLIIVPFTKYRNIFKNRYLWYGSLAGFIIFLPNLFWQISNHLPVINHFAELKRTQLVNVNEVSFLIEQTLIPGMATVLSIAGIIYLLFSRNAWKYQFLGLVCIGVILSLMLLHGKSYYTQGIFPFLIAAGAVAWEKLLKRIWARSVLYLLIILLTIPFIPIGIPVWKTHRLVQYFDHVKTDYKMDFVCRFEDNSIHSLPQDYADMLGWEELTKIADEAWKMIPDKKAAFIYGENYGQAGAITVIGKKYGLPEAVCFSESFRYWIPKRFDPDITSMIYINDEPGEDVQHIFREIIKVGSITNADAREYGTSVYLCRDPVGSFNVFWTRRIMDL
jgi:Dolichyl-phosphate-mannose-protein mannosyltransferase